MRVRARGRGCGSPELLLLGDADWRPAPAGGMPGSACARNAAPPRRPHARPSPPHDVRSLDDWEAAVADWAGDATPFNPSALRVPRLKGGAADGRPARQRVALPPGWLEGRHEEGVPDFLTGDACEG